MSSIMTQLQKKLSRTSHNYEDLDDLEDQISHLSDDSEHFHEESFQNGHHAPKTLTNTDYNHYIRQYSHDDPEAHMHYDDKTATPSYDIVHKISTSGESNEYIHIGRKKYLRSELVAAFGGALVPGYQQMPTYKFANPAPLGLSAFALTTFVLSLVNVQARGVQTANVVVGLAMFYGGFIQLLAGMWELALDNAFGGTALSSYGGFWMSFGAINIPWFGITAAYDSTEELESALGFYLLGWAIFTFGLTLVTLKSTLAFFSLFFSLTLTFILLAAGKFSMQVALTKAGGYFGIITALIAWYNAFAGLATRENSYFTAHVVRLPEIKFLSKNK